MARKIFLSFHYQADSWRVQQIKNIGAIEEQPLLSANKWEDVAKGGDAAIKKWIDEQMAGKSCNVVLIGSQTAGRKWVEYEFRKAWGDGKGVMGIYIHNIRDPQGTTNKGRNPFLGFDITVNGVKVGFEKVVPVYDPKSSDAYNDISNNIEAWIENAIAVRKKY